MASLSLTYSDIQTAVQGDRLASVVDQIPQYIAAAYTDIWNAADWSFKRVAPANFYTSADGTSVGTPSQTPQMPADFAKANNLFDDQGFKVNWLSEIQWEDRYTADTTTGRPTSFAVINRQIYLWPIPTAAYQFRLAYQRRLATRTSGGTVQAGFFQNSSDVPLWDDHHYIIVVRAKLLALKSLTDPTSAMLEDEFGRLLDAMKAEYQVKIPRGYQMPAWR